MIHHLLDALLRLYPTTFRQRFGASMRADWLDGWRARRSVGRRLGYFSAIVADAVVSALAERFTGPLDDPPASSRAGFAGLFDRRRDDLRYALRRLRRQPASTAVAVLTLAAGIGIATSVYALVDGVLLRPLPYPEPECLVRIWSVAPDGEARFLEATAEELQHFRGVTAFAAVGGLSRASRDLADDTGRPTGVRVMRVSEGVFEVLGVEPVLGRSFSPEELAEGRPVVLLSHSFWRSRYAGDAAILGRTVAIQDVAHEIVGVLPAGLDADLGAELDSGSGSRASVWRPFTAEENQDDDRELMVLARLAGHGGAGEALALANAQMKALTARLGGEDGYGAWVEPLHAMLVRGVRGPLWTLLAAVIAVLLLAASNVAHLQLSTLAGRRREMAVRTALGAERGRLTDQLLVESLVVAALAGAGGVVLGKWLLELFRHIAPADLPRLAELGLDWRVVAVMSAVTAAIGLLAGWLPARRSAAVAPAEALAGRGEQASAGGRFQGALVVAEVALATTLVATAGLLFASLSARLDVDHGIAVERTMHLALSPPPSADDGRSREAFYHRVAEEVATLAGVEAAGLGSFQPLEPRGFAMPFTLVDDARSRTDRRVVTWAVDDGWLDAAGARLLAGRGFDAALDGAQGVAIVDDAFVRQHLALPGPAAAIGMRIRHQAYWGEERPAEHRIVGVVETMRAEAAVPVRPRLYLPYRHFPWPRMKLLVRTAGDPAGQLETVRARIWSAEPEAALDRAVPLRSVVEERLAAQRFHLRLLASFAQLALLLAAVGFYAVLSATIARKTREMALRQALGARRLDIVRRVLGQAFAWVLPGLVLGLAAAWAVGEVLASRLHGVQAIEPGIWAAVATTLSAVGLLGCLGPLRRALGVDPMQSLRE